MLKVDKFGRLLIDRRTNKPISAWAILQAGQIDPEWIFLHEDQARQRASLELQGQTDVVPVIVRGGDISRA